MKKYGFNPFILLTSGGDGGEVIGGGSGIGGDAHPMSYAEWQHSGFQYDYDFDGNGSYSVEEFAYWWSDSGFTLEQWKEYNTDLPWPESVPVS